MSKIGKYLYDVTSFLGLVVAAGAFLLSIIGTILGLAYQNWLMAAVSAPIAFGIYRAWEKSRRDYE